MKQFFAATVLLGAGSASIAPPPPTWRRDFNHTGGKGLEVFSVDKVVVEPLSWSGNAKGNLDPTGFGTKRDKANRLVEVWRTRIDPSDQFIHRPTPAVCSRALSQVIDQYAPR